MSVEMTVAMFATLVFLLGLVSVLMTLHARTVMTVAVEHAARQASVLAACPPDDGAATAERTIVRFAGHVHRSDWDISCDDTDPALIVVRIDADMRPVFPIEGWDLRWAEEFRVQVPKR